MYMYFMHIHTFNRCRCLSRCHQRHLRQQFLPVRLRSVWRHNSYVQSHAATAGPASNAPPKVWSSINSISRIERIGIIFFLFSVCSCNYWWVRNRVLRDWLQRNHACSILWRPQSLCCVSRVKSMRQIMWRIQITCRSLLLFSFVVYAPWPMAGEEGTAFKPEHHIANLEWVSASHHHRRGVS